MPPYHHLHLTAQFTSDLLEGDFTAEQYTDLLEALRSLDVDEQAAREAYGAHRLPTLDWWAMDVSATVQLTFAEMGDQLYLLTVIRVS